MAKPQKQQLGDSLADLLVASGEEGDPKSAFEKVSVRILRVDVDGSAWINLGSAIAYYGELKFERLPALKTKSLKTVGLRATTRLVRAHGKGRLYCAHSGWRIRTIHLANETLTVSANEMLAFEDTLDFEISLIGKGISIASGGLLAIKLSGEGWLSIAVHGDPLVLPVTRDSPLNTDPHSTVAWTEGLSPTIKTDITWRTFVGQGGGEAFQMHFEGDGFVAIQPAEDPSKFSGKWLKKIF